MTEHTNETIKHKTACANTNIKQNTKFAKVNINHSTRQRALTEQSSRTSKSKPFVIAMLLLLTS